MLINKRTVSIAALVGAISLSPTGLLPADALTLGRATSGSLSIASASNKVVAGLDSSASATGTYATSPSVSTCTISTTLAAKATFPTSSITLASVANLYVGTVINTMTGITSGTTITAINTGTKVISISPGIASTINNNTAIAFNGCYQTFFSVNNKGAIQVNSFGISQSVTTSSPDSISLQSCSTTWTEATGLCPSGTITTIITTTSGTSAVTQVAKVLAATTGTMRLRALSNTPSRTSTVSITIASNSNFRAGITTNS
ncbi:hypothetical protein MCERE85_00522 [Candidatus Nanopelagicaceae bacterium]